MFIARQRCVMQFYKTFHKNLFKSTYKYKAVAVKCLATNVDRTKKEASESFETVFSFAFVKYFALFNKIKVYHIASSCLVIPTCGLLEWYSLVPQDTFLSASYFGVTAGCLLSIASFPFRNIIGFLYISEDNSLIKISAVDYWGKRNDKIVRAEDWTPLLDLPPKTLDAIYLQPCLTNGTQYKFFVRFGKIHNIQKINQVLE